MYTYDANGNLIESTYPMGYFTSYAYNAKNELCWGAPVAVSSPACAPAPASATVYTYDALLSTTLVEHDPGIWRYVERARRDVHGDISADFHNRELTTRNPARSWGFKRGEDARMPAYWLESSRWAV